VPPVHPHICQLCLDHHAIDMLLFQECQSNQFLVNCCLTFSVTLPSGCKWNESHPTHWYTYDNLLGLALTMLGDLEKNRYGVFSNVKYAKHTTLVMRYIVGQIRPTLYMASSTCPSGNVYRQEHFNQKQSAVVVRQ
jgi:hypothetical protein